MKKKSKSILFLILSLLLITAAVFGGFALAKSIFNGSGKNPDPYHNPERPSSSGTPGPAQVHDPGSKTGVLAANPTEIIYDVDPETGKIEQIILSILNTYTSKLDYIRIDTDVMYTMSSSLYSSLTPRNTTLPQTVTFSQLYRYYDNNLAYDAGRRMIGELLNMNIDYYCALPEQDFDMIFAIRQEQDGNETTVRFANDGEQVKNGYGTEGSAEGFIGRILENAVTNLGFTQRLGYLDIYDSLEAGDISFTNAPVCENNESCWLDTDAMAGMLYDLLY